MAEIDYRKDIATVLYCCNEWLVEDQVYPRLKLILEAREAQEGVEPAHHPHRSRYFQIKFRIHERDVYATLNNMYLEGQLLHQYRCIDPDSVPEDQRRCVREYRIDPAYAVRRKSRASLRVVNGCSRSELPAPHSPLTPHKPNTPHAA